MHVFVQLVTSSPIRELVSCGHQIKCNMSVYIEKRLFHRVWPNFAFYHHRRMLKCFYFFIFCSQIWICCLVHDHRCDLHPKLGKTKRTTTSAYVISQSLPYFKT